jgi:hypothetical protein
LITSPFDPSARAQTNDPPINGGYFEIVKESQLIHYSRRANLIYYLEPRSQIDLDIDENGNLAPDTVVITGWSDSGAQGEFGYTTNGMDFHTTSLPQVVNAYRPHPDFIGTLQITMTVDDVAIYNDDPPVTSPPWKVTVWEFTTTLTPSGSRLHLNDNVGPYTAEITPPTDHEGNSMAGFIQFSLTGSAEPSYCLNACCEGGPEFCLTNGCSVFPFCADDIFLECPWNQQKVATGEGWRTTAIADNDLKFPPNQSGLTINSSGWPAPCNSAVTTQRVLQKNVMVTCLDYGAYGFMTATVSGTPFGSATARWKDTLLEIGVPIPYDMNFNGLADVWEAQHGLFVPFPLGVATPGVDVDNTPAGDGTQGDGLSVYEEYRGLLWRGQWTELDPEEKDMFVMNFGAIPRDPANGDWSFVISNDAITSPNGFPQLEIPQLWLFNANEGAGYPYRVMNFLSESFHRRDVYAAIVVPGTDLNDPQAYGETSGPIWGEGGPPIIETNVNRLQAHVNDPTKNVHGWPFLACLTHHIAHELGHTVLWHRTDYDATGHHNGKDAVGNPLTTLDCHIWTYFAWADWAALPTDFCPNNPGCIHRWKLNP